MKSPSWKTTARATQLLTSSSDESVVFTFADHAKFCVVNADESKCRTFSKRKRLSLPNKNNMNNQSCILSTSLNNQVETNYFSKGIYNILLTPDDIMNHAAYGMDTSIIGTNNTQGGEENLKFVQTFITNPYQSTLENMLSSTPNTMTTLPITQNCNISHSSDNHSSPNPSTNNYQTTTSTTPTNITTNSIHNKIESSPLLKMLQQSMSPSSQYSPITMFGDEPTATNTTTIEDRIDGNSIFTPLSKSVTATCYQLIDEALKDTQSSLGLIWSKIQDNTNNKINNVNNIQQETTTSNNASNSPATPTNTNQTIFVNNNIDIFPFNLDSEAINMITTDKKKGVKRKQTTEKSLPPSKKQSVTYEIVPMTQHSTVQVSRPIPPVTRPTTDRRRKYKVRFGPNMFDEIAIKKNSHKDLSPPSVATIRK